MKVFDKNTLFQKNLQQLVLGEVKIHSMMSHPHIIKLFYVAEDEINFYSVMEKAENFSLASKILYLLFTY